MKKNLFLLVLAFYLYGSVNAQDSKTEAPPQLMQITTIESVLAGGVGRSKMIITNSDGTQKETDIENLFSLVGLNFKNIKKNEAELVKTLKDYTSNGWKMAHVTSLTLSQNDTGSGGIFMTRYLLSKPDEKK
jgi:hypothetical protein